MARTLSQSAVEDHGIDQATELGASGSSPLPSLRRLLGDGRRPRLGAGALLNFLSVSLAVAALLRLTETEILIDGLWVTLAVGAFVFTAAVALIRIAIGATFIIAQMATELDPEVVGMPIELADLAEWPLLLAISIIVTLMAHRMSTTARRYAALYRSASDRLLSAQETERGRLSQDLHDSVGQTLTAVMLTLDAAEQDLQRGAETEARTTIKQAHDLTASALEETRDVAMQLRPPRIIEVGLGAALRDLAASAGVPVMARFDPTILPPGLLRDSQAIGIYRVAQEALGNAARHARATRIWLDADADDGSIRLVIADDGVGFDPDAPGHRGMGLPGMRERAAVLGGRLSVQSRPRGGTVVRLAVPYVPALSDHPLRTFASEAGR